MWRRMLGRLWQRLANWHADASEVDELLWADEATLSNLKLSSDLTTAVRREQMRVRTFT